ncbi:phage major tail protein, TP901-1 family [Pedomonas sp. V897]|uniref:phage major tail protein, TP901-1 family n=1 Tax=Pedomonas sp. V897 TaxID=3446482 RepID=UPI003EE1DACE
MAAEKGSAFLLRISNGGSPVTYTTVAGMRTTQLAINAEGVVVTHKGSGGWREMLPEAGVRSVSIAGSGVFTGSAAEARLKQKALAGAADDFEVVFESGEAMRGAFLITRLDYGGDFNGERTYTLALESTGPVTVL